MNSARRRQLKVLLAAMVLTLLAVGIWAISRLRSADATTASPAAPPARGTIRWVGCDISKLSFIDTAAAAFQKKTGSTIEIEDGGATRGIRDVAAGKAHMGGSCRHALDIPEERGIKLIPIAWDALVVIVHPSNPVSDIAKDELRRVLTGAITRWKELGGDDTPIEIFERKGKLSGVGAGTRTLLFRNPDQELSPSARLFDSTRPLEEELERSPRAIAMTGISSARLRKVKLLNIDGRAPTRENVVKGEYLLYRPLYITVPEKPDPIVEAFIAFLFSPEGEEIIRSTGTVTMSEGKDLWEKFKQQMASR